eukprot:CAMPEP_0172619730 /NCGR_PEP_ID=MMETSP1068-20121228/96562_1 /TAXON_ID=35684 /ORGANISM="Pseudopedinella elastica, Strain CCMP716" /LENGTH=540 /DNA_ID=CAMNT_0013426643 /DNA_START=201 /DNA_END=1823 /DNA_ORIENTATION=+
MPAASTGNPIISANEPNSLSDPLVPPDVDDAAAGALTKKLAASRDVWYLWCFMGYIGFGIFVELYTNLFVDVIDKGNYTEASFYSSVAITLYSVASFFVSPVAATASDSIGRRPIFLLATISDTVAMFVSGAFPNNWVFIICVILFGGGDNSYATGMGLLADYVGSTPMYHAGSKDDSHTFQCLFWVARFGADTSKMELDQAAYFEYEMNIHFVMTLLIQSVGTVVGILAATILYYATLSYQISYLCGTLFFLPMVPYVYWYMPETVPSERLQPLTCAACCDALKSQLESVTLFADNRRLWGIAFVGFLIQFVSTGIFDVFLYWGEWKFGWLTPEEAVALVLSFCPAALGAIGAPWLAVRAFGGTLNYAALIASFALLASVASVFAGLATSDLGVFIALFFFGVGFGNSPAIYSQISAEAGPEKQGRVQGFNYAVYTVAWASAPLIYQAMFAAYIDDDSIFNDEDDGDDDCTDDHGGDDGCGDDDVMTHVHNLPSSLIWWVSAVVLFIAAAFMFFVVGNSTASKLASGSSAAAPAPGAAP